MKNTLQILKFSVKIDYTTDVKHMRMCKTILKTNESRLSDI